MTEAKINPEQFEFPGEETLTEPQRKDLAKLKEIIQRAMIDEDGNPRVSKEEKLIQNYAKPLAELAVKNRERIDALESKVNDLEKIVIKTLYFTEEIYGRTGMNFKIVIDEDNQVIEVEE